MGKHKSYAYIYPMIEDVVNYEKNLIGCYIGDENKPQYNNHIFLRYTFDGSLSSAYAQFEENIQQCPLLEDFYDIKDNIKNNTVMFVFKVPEEYQDDYNLFLESKYSKMSKDYKNKIIKCHAHRNKNNRKILEGVLFKTKLYQLELEEKIGEKLSPDMEFSSKWEKSKEIFPKIKKTYSYDELIKSLEHESKT